MIHFDTYIEKSKKTCELIFGMDPEEIPFLKVALTSEQLQLRKQKYESTRGIIQQFMQKLLLYINGTPTLVIATDSEGYVMDIYGDESIRKMVSSLGITKGVRFDEQDVGTNAVSLALEHGEPIQLIGDDHYHYCLVDVACYSAPFSYSNGQLAGTISLMTTVDYATHFHLGLLSSAVDTIEREIQLQKQNDQLHLLNQVFMDATPLGIVITNHEGQIQEFNASAEIITGISRDEMIGEDIQLMHELHPFINEVLNKGETIEELEITFPFQGETTCLLDVLPLFDSFNHLVGAFAQFRDMTSYNEMQDQVVQSEKLSAIGKLGAGFAHEIRNPLTSIIGLTQLMKETNPDNPYMNIITSELERIKNLVNQFVMLGKPTVSQKKMVNLTEIVHDTVKLMNSNAHLYHVQIHFRPSAHDLIVYMDPSQIKQVLINFIKNAFEAMPRGGHIWIDLDIRQNEVTLSIKDEGDGMTEEEVARLGAPFFSTKESGLGMGLSICFDIIKAHRGTISIDSTKGNGTMISFTLPINQKGTNRLGNGINDISAPL